MMLTLDDARFLLLTVAMYGGIGVLRGLPDNPYHVGAWTKPDPLEEAFDADYFGELVAHAKKSLSAKAFLATEQRIPGVGNGVLQDILFAAGIHPKRKLETLSGEHIRGLFATLKSVLAEMTASGGRDTERDLFGNRGGYRVRLSKNTCSDPCPVCGAEVIKASYLGGAIYYCPVCQPLEG